MDESSKRTGRLIVRTHCGLGNRLGAMLSAAVVGEILEVPVDVYWPEKSEDCFGAFSSLFEPESVAGLTLIPGDERAPWVDAQTVSTGELRRALSAGETLYLNAYTIFGFELVGSDVFFGRIQERLRALRPSPRIVSLLGPMASPQIGVHIRCTDHFPCRLLTPRWTYRTALKVIEEKCPGATVFICSDSPGFVRELQQSSRIRIVTSPGTEIEAESARSSLSGTQAALVDLWTLARCKVILCASLSTFAFTAKNIGGAEAFSISAAADPVRLRLPQFAWFLARQMDYVAATDSWKPRGQAKGSVGGVRGLFATTFARIVRSSFYQDHPLPGQRRSLYKRLAGFFNSRPCQDALAQVSTPSV